MRDRLKTLLVVMSYGSEDCRNALQELELGQVDDEVTPARVESRLLTKNKVPSTYFRSRLRRSLIEMQWEIFGYLGVCSVLGQSSRPIDKSLQQSPHSI